MKFLFLSFGVLVLLFVVILFKYLRIIMNVFLNLPLKAVAGDWVLPPGEEVMFLSLKGHPLSGIFFRGGGKATIIFCHEFGSDKSFSVPYSKFLLESGYNVFAFDFRGHGQSLNQDGYIPRVWTTTNEIDDLLGAIHYIRTMPDLEIGSFGVLGVSRGAATALTAIPFAPEIKAVVSDSAFSTLETITDYMQKWVTIFAYVPFIYHRFSSFVIRRINYRSYRLLGRMAMKTAQLRYRFRFPSLEKVLSTSPVPVLFIHGCQDSFINFHHARFLYEKSAGPKELWLVEGARHNEAVKVAPEEYARKVTDFFKKYLEPGRIPA